MKLRDFIFFQVPSFIQLSNLKTLHLSLSLDGGNGIAEQLEQLFSGCHHLQELVLTIPCPKRIKIFIPGLRTLVIHHPNFICHLFGECAITIYAENLMVLQCINCLTSEILPYDLPPRWSSYMSSADSFEGDSRASWLCK